MITVEEKLFVTKFHPDVESHIRVNQDICIFCTGKECTKFCPASVFNLSNVDNELIVAYESCLECGACKMGCPFGAIEYKHPKEGHGTF